MQVSISSTAKKHEPTYYLTVSVPGKGGMPPETLHIQAPFTTWFTADGYFVAKPFQQWLATSIETIGDADPKNASRDERDELAAPNPEVERIAGAGQSNGTVDVSGADSKGKGSKRGKRKG